MASGEEYSYLYKREEDPEDARKITRTRTVRNTISTRVLRGISPDSITSSATNPRNVLGSSPRQSRSRLTRATEQQQREAMSSDYKSSTYDDFPKDENQPPDQDDGALKRAQSEGDLLNGELKLRKIKKIRSLPSLERKVRFSSTERDEANAQKLHQRAEELAHGTYTDESIKKSDDGKKRSRSYDELSWKKPHIDVKRKVELLPQKERSRSADSPRKGILKTKRITQTNTIRVSGSIPLDQQGTTSDNLTKLGTETRSTSSSIEQEQMDYSTYSTPQTSGGQENVFQLPKRYRVQEDIELEPQTKPKGMIFTRRWKSEPFLVEKKQQRRSKSMERLPSEKETKLSNVKIDLIRPIDLKPLKPAYSVGDLSFETSERSDEQFHLKLQRWKSNPELVSREKFDRKPGKEFETKIVRALPVHLQPLHQPTPAKETQVKTTEVKDTAMQATYVKHTKSEGTQAFLQTSPITIENEPVKYKSTQTMNMPEKLTVATPVVVEFQKSEIKQETPKVRRLKIKETTLDEMTEQEIEEQRRVEKEKRDHDMKQERLVVQYVPDKPRLKEQEWPTTEVCEEYATEVRLRRNVESKETKRGIEIGRIDDIDMEQAPVEEDYPETRRVKKMKTTHVEYRPSSEKTVRHVSEKQTRPKEDITFGRIESTRKAVGVTTMDEPTAADRLRVEEITFPRRADSTTAAVEMQTQQGKKRKKETSVKYEKIPTDVIKVTRQSTPRCFVDEADEYQRKVKREPSIGRIEDLHVEEKTKVNGSFPTAPEIGSFIFKSVPDEQPHEVRRERKPKKKRTDHLHVRDVDYDKVHEQKIRPGTDHRKISREHVTTEKVTVSRRDMTTREESEKARYRKEQDIGRIIIEEIPEKEEMTKREVSRKEVVKPSPEVTVKRHEVKEIPRTRVREEVIKVRHTDVTPVESTMEKKVTTYLERADGVREEKRQDRVIKPRYIPDKRYEIHDETKKRSEDTMVLGRDVSTEKVTVTRTDRIHREETELPKYPEEPCVGRIAIEEMPERREEKPREVHRKRDRTQRRTDVTEAERPYEKEEVIKVGKLDVHEAEKVPLESTRVGERAATYRERVEGSRKGREDTKREHNDRLDVEDVAFEKVLETKPRRDEISQKHVTTKKISVSKRDITATEETEKPKYPRELDIGRIVIEELPTEKEEVTKRKPTRKETRPKSTEVTITQHEVEEVPTTYVKEDVMKVGKLDVTGLEKAPDESRRVEKRVTTYTEKVDGAHKARKDIMPERQKVDRLDVKDVEFEKVRETTPRRDEISRKHIATEKVTVSKRDLTTTEETEKPKYARELDIGHIVIEELPEEKKEVTKRKPTRKETRPKSTEVTITQHDVEEIPRTYVKEDVIKVGKLDVTALEKAPVESRVDEKVTTYTEKLDFRQKPRKETKEEKRRAPSYVEETRYHKTKPDETKPCLDETRVSRREVSTERVTVTRAHGTVIEETEPAKYPREREVGRIVIEEMPAEKEKPYVHEKFREKPKTTEVTVTRGVVPDISRHYEREEMIKIGRLDLQELEKVPKESKTRMERLPTQKERVESRREARNDMEPEEKRIDCLDVRDVDFEKIRETKPHRDMISRSHVTADVTVSKRDITTKEVTEKPRYSKELDIGRIVIEESPEEKEAAPERKPTRKEVRPKSTEVTITPREIEEVPRSYVKEDVIKIGKLDVTGLEKVPDESRRVEERVKTYTERLDRTRKPTEEKRPKEERLEPHHMEDVTYHKKKHDDTRPCVDETRVSRREVTSERVTITRADGTRTEDAEQLRYPQERDVGRIVIEEMPKEETPDVDRKHTKKAITTQARKDFKAEEKKIDRLDVKDVDFDKVRETKPHRDEIPREHVTTEKVTLTKRDITTTENAEKPRYPKELDIGRIVIEEIPEEKEEIPKRKLTRPKSTEVTITQHDVYEVPSTYIKQDVTKVGKLDVTGLNKAAVESRKVEETLKTYTERLDRTHKVTKDFKPEKRIDRLDVKDVEFEKVRETKPHRDEISHEHVTTEKVTLSKRDTTTTEDTEKPRYPKELDIGRIVIEEIPEKKEEIPKHKLTRPRSTEITVTQHEVDEVPSTYIKEDVMKVGKLDVSGLEKAAVEYRKVEDRVKTYTERLDGVRKPRKERPEEPKIEPRYIEDLSYHKEKRDQTKPCVDETRVSRREVSTERVSIARADGTRTEETEQLRYPQERDVGRIVIEEMAEERRPDIYRKRLEKPMTTQVTVTREDVKDISRPYEKKDLIKIGGRDIHELEKAPVESTRVEERPLTQTEIVEYPQKVKKDMNLEEERVDRLDVQDVELEEFRRAKPLRDEISRGRETTEKLTISKRDFTTTEDTEKPRYPKELDIGRIVIEEIPEEKEEIPERKLIQKDMRPRSTEVTVTQHEVEEVPSTYIKKDAMKVGKLDVTGLEKAAVESRKVEEKIMSYTDRLDGLRKPKESKVEDRRTQPRYIEDISYREKRDTTKPCVDETRVSQREISTERVTVTRADGTRTEETKQLRYPQERDVGRILIEELPDEEKPDVYREHYVKPMTTQLTDTKKNVKEISRPQEKEDAMQIGRLDVHRLEKTPVESRRVEETFLTKTERVEGPRQVRKERPEKKTIDRTFVEDVDYDKILKTEPRTDDTRTSRRHVTTEKVTVSRRDIALTEETEKPRHAKDLDIGRIVIEEIPDEQEDIIRHETTQKETRPRSTEVGVTRREIREVPSTYDTEDVIKIGRLDVTDLEKAPVETRRVKEKHETHKERMTGDRKPKERKPEKPTKPRHIEDVSYKEKRYQTKPCVDETKVSRKEVSTERVTVTTADGTVIEEIQGGSYPRDREFGRIVIEEMPDDEKPRDVYRDKHVRTTKLTTKEVVKDISKPYKKDDETQVGQLDIRERRPVESKRLEERLITETERVKEPEKKSEKPKTERIDQIYTDDIVFQKASQYEPKPRMDDTDGSRKHVTTEKVTVSRHDVTRTEDTQKPKYAKDVDISRIIIEEIPEEKKEVPRREVSRKDDIVRRYEVGEVPRAHVPEDTIKIGRLDVTDIEKTPLESRKLEEKVSTYKETVDRGRKPMRDRGPEEQRKEPLHVEDVHCKETRKETRPCLDEATVSRRAVSTEKVTVTRTDGTRIEETGRHEHPRERDVGRIIIDEMDEEKPRKVRPKFDPRPKTTELTVTKGVRDVSRPCEEEDLMRVGRIDFHEKAPEETMREKGRQVKETEMVERHRKVRKDEQLEKDKYDHLHVRDVEYDKIRPETKPYTDETQISRRITTEKVSVSRRDMATTEETEKPRYAKELDVGRIVIEEVPEQREETLKPDVLRKDVRPKSTEARVTREVTEIPRKTALEKEATVRRTDEADVHEKPWESRRLEERVTIYTDRVDGARKPRKEEKPEEQRLEPSYIDDIRYRTEKREQAKPCVDETRVSRREVSTERVTVTRADGTVTEEIARPKHPKEQEVGRIIIEEIAEKKEEPERVEGLRKVKKDERTSHIQIEDAERISRYETRPVEDDTKFSRKHVTTEKVTVSRDDVSPTELTEKPKYPKDIHVSHIVIEEIPEEKKPTQRVVKDVQKGVEKEETLKVGTLDLRDLEKDVVESTKTEERHLTRMDKIDHTDKMVRDQRIARETMRGAGVTEEKVRLGRKPTDKVCLTDKSGQLIVDKTDGGWYIDEKTGQWTTVDSSRGVDTVREHEVVRDSVWVESLKPLEEQQQETVVTEKPVAGDSITITKDDRKKFQEDVRVSMQEVRDTEKKEERKVPRFKIDESRDLNGGKKDKHVREKPKEKTEEKEQKESQEPVVVKRAEEKQTQTKEKPDERDRKIAYYEKKEKERRRRAYERKRYEEERFHMKRASSDPWIHVKKREKRPEFEVCATQVIHDPSKYTERYERSVRKQPATLPWIEVRRRGTEKREMTTSRKSQHGYGLTRELTGQDRLLLLKIPQKLFISMQNGEKGKIKEIEIPWMEIEATRDFKGDGLPWIELEAYDPKTGRDRLIMLKIPREMVLKTSKLSKSAEREIRLPWNDVTRYWEETGQIPIGSAVRMRVDPSRSMTITLPKDVSNDYSKSSSHKSVNNLPTIRLMMPKKFYTERSWQERPLINYDPSRRIKLRFNNQSNSKAIEDVRTIRLDEYERKNNYMPVALTRDYPRRVLLADGTEWKRLEVDDLWRLDQERVQKNPSRFCNVYEIGKESEAQSFPDLRQFAKENGGTSARNPKIFSFVLNADK